MAFHRGTLRGLLDLKLADAVAVASTVSGGSVFGAAWLCRTGDHYEFLDGLVPILKRGFFRPAVFSLGFFKVLLKPGFSRTHRLAEVFSDELLQNRRLEDLPESPRLCLNASVLNHAMPGRFSRAGFSCHSVGPAGPGPDHRYPEVPLPRRNLGFAVAASACFPFALPPVTLDASELPELSGRLQGNAKLHLTDGGILENLGVERLLASGRFHADDIIASDAGVADASWAPGWKQSLTSFGAFALSRQILARLLTVMNDKQSKTMRQLLLRRLVALGEAPAERRLWFVRIDQTWDRFFEGISPARRVEFARGGAWPTADAKAPEVIAFLEKQGVDLAPARAHWQAGDSERANQVTTNFTGLSEDDLAALDRHARWQVHACRAVYGDIHANVA